MTLLQSSNYSDWYTRLNQIRTKHRMATITVKTVAQNTPALSSQMSTVQTDINTTKNTEYHLRKASINTTIPNFAKGNVILLSTKTAIDNILTAMFNVCHYDGSDYSGRDDHDSSDYTGDNSYDGSHHSGCDGYCNDCRDYYECGSGDDPARFE